MTSGRWLRQQQLLFCKAMSTIGPDLPPHLRASSSTESVAIGPAIPETLNGPSENEDESDDDDYGPALPPDLLASRSAPSDAGPSKRLVGPSMPPTGHNRTTQYYDDDSDDDVGPRPLPSGVKFVEIDPVRQFMEKEERRRQQVEVSRFFRTVARFECQTVRSQEAAKPKALKRDEWMLVPPSSSDLLGSTYTSSYYILSR